jgi:hypothetical protein
VTESHSKTIIAPIDFVPLAAFLKLLRAARNARVLDALQ